MDFNKAPLSVGPAAAAGPLLPPPEGGGGALGGPGGGGGGGITKKLWICAYLYRRNHDFWARKSATWQLVVLDNRLR